MANLLFIFSDIPFFPGKMGVDFFQVRFLAQRHHVGVIGPRYDVYPAEGVHALRETVQTCYLWPDPIPGVPAAVTSLARSCLGRLLRPTLIRFRLPLVLACFRLPRGDAAGLGQLAILANCAPYLRKALGERRWDALVVVQSDKGPWLRFLPPHLPVVVYFHDLRSDYLEKRASFEPDPGAMRRQARLALAHERAICAQADAVGFVSVLDRERARHRLGPLPPSAVAPIPVDLDYFVPRPADWPQPGRPVVLFTGHLGHPPNVDAVRYFVTEIWPAIRQEHPGALFRVAGCFPAPDLLALGESRPDVEILANVPDIRPLFWDASVYVVPMRFGGGVRQKILEAWAMGVPVVVTPMGAEGLPAADGVNCLIAEGPVELAARVGTVLRDAATARPLVERARSEVAGHALDRACPEFESLVTRAVVVRRTRSPRVLLDLGWLDLRDGGRAVEAARGLAGALLEIDPDGEYRVLTSSRAFRRLALRRGTRVRRIAVGIRHRWGRRARAAVLGLLGGSPSDMEALHFAHRLDCDIVHAFLGRATAGTELLPTVLSIDELAGRLEGSGADGTAGPDLAVWREACLRARHVVCPSEATRQLLHRRWQVPLGRISVVWPAPPPSAGLGPSAGEGAALLARLGVTGSFVYFPADALPHKNHRVLLEAFARARPELARGTKLVLTGALPGTAQGLRPRLDAPDLRGAVVHGGEVSGREERALVWRASVLVYPSRVEDFGLPLVEAMTAGVPIVAADHPALRETAADAARYVDASEPGDVARALVELQQRADLRQALVRAGRARAAVFTWRAAAARMLHAFRVAHGVGEWV